MSLPQNALVQVVTYQPAGLAYMLFHSAFIPTCNPKFNNFQTFSGNLGDTVSYELPYRLTSQNSLVGQPQGVVQRKRTLTVNQQRMVPWAFSNQQIIFNINEQSYLDYIGRGAMTQLSYQVESFIAGLCETIPYRYFGDGVTTLSNIQQVAQMLAQYRAYGSAMDHDLKVYWPITTTPSIASSAANQFVVDRNEEIMSKWLVANWKGVEFYESEVLPTHVAGNVGNQIGSSNVLTVVSTNDPTGNNITQITFSGAALSDANSIKAFDSFTFNDGVPGQPNLRYLTFAGYINNGLVPVQLQVTADAASNGAGDVTVNISPALCMTPGNQNQNIVFNIVAGMQVTFLPSHICGMIVGGNAMYLAMPQLPDMYPYPTSNEKDPLTGISTRLYSATIPGQNEITWWHDCIFGVDAVPEYTMKIVIPLT
jgi:hypothetical protein